MVQTFRWSSKIVIIPYTTEYRTVRYSNGHFLDTFEIQFSNGFFKMAAIIGSHFVKTIRKPDFFVRFLNGLVIWKPDRSFLTSSLDRFGMNKIFFYDSYQ
jgi:hypothetical protein